MLRPKGITSLQPIALPNPARTTLRKRAASAEAEPSGTGGDEINSDRGPTDGPGPPRREMPGPSVKLALVVVLLAVGIVIAGLIAQVLTGSTPPVPAPASVATAKGSPLKAIPATSALAPLVSSGEPPNDIVNAIVLPAGSVPGAVINDTSAAASYDEQRLFTIDAPAAEGHHLLRSRAPRAGLAHRERGEAEEPNGVRGSRPASRERRLLLGDRCRRLPDNIPAIRPVI